MQRGGGLLIVASEHTTWPEGEKDLMPGTLGATVDRTEGRGATLGFSTAATSCSRSSKRLGAATSRPRRSIAIAASNRARRQGARAVRRRRRRGRGKKGRGGTRNRVGVGPRQSYSDLPLKPVYLPLVTQLVKYLAQFEAPHAWQTVGQVVDVQSLTKSRANWVVVTPSGKRVTSTGPLELDEQGVYEVRPAGLADGFTPQAVAVNIDPAEEDLRRRSTRLNSSRPSRVTRHPHRRRRCRPPRKPNKSTSRTPRRSRAFGGTCSVTGLLLLAAETVVSNRLSHGEKFL